jgi:hypothetical protein
MEYLSLYDYLKKPSGKELGGEVCKGRSDLKESHIKLKGKYRIQNTQEKYTYTQKIFLNFHFRKPEHIHIEDLPGQINTDIDDDDLPF